MENEFANEYGSEYGSEFASEYGSELIRTYKAINLSNLQISK